MTDPTVTDLRRELDKAREALASTARYLHFHAQTNAELHCSPNNVIHSPLHAKVITAIAGIDHALARTEPDPETAEVVEATRRREAGLLRVLANLDRCEHGRHEGDECSGTSGCDGPSHGNPHLPTGRVIGYDRAGGFIVMPPRGLRHDPSAWQGSPIADEVTDA